MEVYGGGYYSMSVIMFAVGRSGSGKSTAVRHVMQLMEDKKYSTIYVSDYAILRNMSMQNEYQGKFRVNEYNGFDVLDFSVMDTALDELVKHLITLNASQKYDIIFVEFARDTYIKAFRTIASAELLKNAYVLFVEAELNKCIERIYKRVLKYQGPDYHFLSANIMQTYFQQNNLSYFNTEFKKQFDIQEHHLKVICNEATVGELEVEVDDIAKHIFQEVPLLQRVTTGV